MQVISHYAVQSHLVQDFKYLKINAIEFPEPSLKVSDQEKSLQEVGKNEVHGKDDEVEEIDEEEEEFSFMCVNPDESAISADEIFCDGKIRPVFPLFDRHLLFSDEKSESSNSLRPPLKKIFVEQPSGSSSEAEEPEGPFCPWGGKAIEASPEVCKKSNSTGFSKLRRFRELVLRSNSDGKDAFVFLNSAEKGNKTTAKSGDTTTGITNEKKVKRKGKSKETVSSVLERHYGKKGGEKRKSYLPYRQDIFGFFTNVNGLSRNVHPF